jgi:hypothetical protein
MEKSWFLELREPAKVFEAADKMKWDIGSERFFRDPKTAWLKEAWIIGRFGLIISADLVALNLTDPPDACLRKGGTEFQIEITEALYPDRKRGDEFKKGQEIIKPILDEEEPFILEQKNAPWHYNEIDECIRNAVSKKLEKMKAFRLYDHLLVHLSTGDDYLKENEVKEGFIKIVDDYSSKEHFHVVILFGKRVAGPKWLVGDQYVDTSD